MPATYRYELAKTGRAGCQNVACKHAGIKIEKGELRFGSLVQIKDHDTWMWKHWGCVTPAQIEKVIEQIGGLDGLDLDNDLDILDGYDELDGPAQEKIKFALTNGHVEDEDWRGEPELNRPGMKGINKRSKKKKKDGDDNDGDEGDDAGNSEAVETPKPKKKKSKKKNDEADEADRSSPTPAKKKAPSKKRKAAEPDDHDELALDEEKPKKKRAPKGSKSAKTAVKDEDMDVDELSKEVPQATKKAKGKKSTTKSTGKIVSQVDGADDKHDNSKKASTKVKVEAEPDSETLEKASKKKTAKPKTAKRNEVKQEEESEHADDEEVPQNNPVSAATGSTKTSKANKKKKVKDEEDGAETVDTKVAVPSGSKKRRTKSKA